MLGGDHVLAVSRLKLSLILLPDRVVGVAVVGRLLVLPVVALVLVRGRDGLVLLRGESLLAFVMERLEHHLPLLEYLCVFVKSFLWSSCLILLLMEWNASLTVVNLLWLLSEIP